MMPEPLIGSAVALLRVGLLTLNLASRQVVVAGRILRLIGKEFDFLALLVRRQGRVINGEVFLDRLYGGIDKPQMATVRVIICKLRKKLALVCPQPDRHRRRRRFDRRRSEISKRRSAKRRNDSARVSAE